MTDDDIRSVLERLSASSPTTRATALAAITDHPVADPRVLAACEKLLADRAIALVRPDTFAEVRCAAADAVATLRGAPVELDDAFAPCSTSAAIDLASAAGFAAERSTDAIVRALEALARANALPRRRLVRTPPADDPVERAEYDRAVEQFERTKDIKPMKLD
jgi:hypothetical protein